MDTCIKNRTIKKERIEARVPGDVKDLILCETRFFRATGSQYREPLARGDQSQRRGAVHIPLKINTSTVSD